MTRSRNNDAQTGAINPPHKPRRLRFWLGRVLLVTAATIAVFGSWSLVADNWQQAVYREAYLPELEAAAKVHPADGYLLTLLGIRHAEAAEFRVAAQALESAAGTGSQSPSLWLTWAACEAADNNLQKAKQVLLYGINTKHCDPPAPAREALARLQNLEAAQAGNVPSLQAAQAVSPGGPTKAMASFVNANVFDSLLDWQYRRDPDRSGFDFRRREALASPQSPQAQVRWMEALGKNRRLGEAQNVGKAALAAFPSNPQVITAYADVLYAGGASATAGVEYRRAVTLAPNYVPAVMGLGKVALEKQLYQIAVGSYEKATQLMPKNPDAWVGLGRAYYSDSHRYDKSLQAFETAGRLAPNRTDFFPYWSDALIANYRVPEAEALLLRRLAAAPDDARAHYLLGKLLYDSRETSERIQQAESHLRRSLQIQPNVPVVKVALAKLLLDKKDPDAIAEAGTLLGEALEDNPRDDAAMRLLATAYRKIGRKDRAEETTKLATRLAEYAEKVRALEDKERQNVTDVQVHKDLVALYESGGEAEKARRQDEMIYMLTHHREAAERGLSQLSEAASRAAPATKSELERGRSSKAGATGSVSGTVPPAQSVGSR